MNLDVRKYKVIERIIQSSNEMVIEKVEEILDESGVVAFSNDGKPLGQKQYSRQIDNAWNDSCNGNTVPQEVLRNRLKNKY